MFCYFIDCYPLKKLYIHNTHKRKSILDVSKFPRKLVDLQVIDLIFNSYYYNSFNICIIKIKFILHYV
jgi:hypothetical protein